MKQNTIVLHDYFETAEGGGKLSLILARGLGADLAYGFKAAGHPFFEAGFAGREFDLACRSDIQLLRQYRLARAFERHTSFLVGYEVAVYSGSYSPLTVRKHPAGKNILYCHTPPRFIYDQREHFLTSIPVWQRPILSSFLAWFKPRYEDSVARMDVIIANSDNVRKRIRDHLGLESVVIHPPCETKEFSWRGQEEFYLSAARLDALKRVGLIVEAFRGLPDKKLVVISDGPERSKIIRLAKDASNVEIKGLVSEAEYSRLVGECIATIYIPKDEDFGMTPIESMAAGKPVIGVAEGGLAETVVHEETGLLLPPDFGPGDLARAIREMDPETAADMREACERRSKMFDSGVFLRDMTGILGSDAA